MQQNRGFTFIEILVVILLAGLVLGISFPMLSKFASDPLKETARKISWEMKRLYFDAVSNRSKLKLYYDLDNNSYWMTREKTIGRLVEEEKYGSLKELPDGISFADITTRLHGKRQHGRIFTTFFVEGWADYTEVHLRQDDKTLSLILDSATGDVKIHEGYVEQSRIYAD